MSSTFGFYQTEKVDLFQILLFSLLCSVHNGLSLVPPSPNELDIFFHVLVGAKGSCSHAFNP